MDVVNEKRRIGVFERSIVRDAHRDFQARENGSGLRSLRLAGGNRVRLPCANRRSAAIVLLISKHAHDQFSFFPCSMLEIHRPSRSIPAFACPKKATKYLLFHVVQPQPPPFHIAKRQPPHRKPHNCILPSSVHIINSFPVYQPKSYLLLPIVNLNTKLTMTAANSASVKIVGPRRSSKPPWPRMRMLLARQWNVKSA
jgi:hypothetical protein